MAKYLIASKKNGRSYWWLIEAHSECGKVVQRKLKYWGVHKPSEKYRKYLMPLDDDKPLDDLWLIWQTDTKAWRSQKWVGFTFWLKRGQEEWFWAMYLRAAEKHSYNDRKDIGVTRASSRTEAIKNAKEGRYITLIPLLVLQRMNPDRLYQRP
jgi:hypothetical protein